MASSDYNTIQVFLEKKDPKDVVLQAALNLGEKETALFMSALNLVPEKEGLGLSGVSKMLGKLVKTPAPYLTKFKKKGLIQRGKSLGEWSVTKLAIKKMSAILEGKDLPASMVFTGKKKRGGGKKAKVSKQDIAPVTRAKISARLAKVTVGDLLGRYDKKQRELEAVIENATKELVDIAAKKADIIRMFG